ncbi:hypothetical protein BDF19DRAFT_425444 [Syncephalis fuscata]|nr:hypothetical protein BDF19DRAFT_425430 [Syncephalis fuscata]KAI9592437.1 hypothetical protein BDF19DRAFT_425444 [Syncephalis fuscata]
MTVVRVSETPTQTLSVPVSGMPMTDMASWRVRATHINRQDSRAGTLVIASVSQSTASQFDQAVPTVMLCNTINAPDDERDIADIVVNLVVPDLLHDKL